MLQIKHIESRSGYGNKPKNIESNLNIPDEYKPFFKMMSVGVPKVCVAHKLRMIGLDPSILDNKNTLNSVVNNNKSNLNTKTKSIGLGGLFSAIKSGKKLKKTKIIKRNKVNQGKRFNKNQKHTPSLQEILNQIKKLRKV